MGDLKVGEGWKLEKCPACGSKRISYYRRRAKYCLCRNCKGRWGPSVDEENPTEVHY